MRESAGTTGTVLTGDSASSGTSGGTTGTGKTGGSSATGTFPGDTTQTRYGPAQVEIAVANRGDH